MNYFKFWKIGPLFLSQPYGYPRTSQDMNGALHTDFANFYAIWGSRTKILALLQLRKIWILTKFEGCSSKTIFIPSWGWIEKTKSSILNFSKVVRDINTKFLPVVNLCKNPLCAKNQGHRCSKFGFPAKNVKIF